MKLTLCIIKSPLPPFAKGGDNNDFPPLAKGAGGFESHKCLKNLFKLA